MSEPQLPPEFGTGKEDVDLGEMGNVILIASLRKQLEESRQRVLELATRLEEADQRACDAEQRFAARDARIKGLEAAQSPLVLEVLEARAALGALASVLQKVYPFHGNPAPEACDFCHVPPSVEHSPDCEYAQALRPDAVQQAVAQYREAMAVIERARRAVANAQNRHSDAFLTWEDHVRALSEKKTLGDLLGEAAQERSHE